LPPAPCFDERANEYDRWFDDNRAVYEAELAAVRSVAPAPVRALEIGVGTGRFAAPLGVAFGVEPSAAMAIRARDRGVRVVRGTAERLPFPDAAFDLVLMITVLCFLDDMPRALAEARRVVAGGGALVVGLLDRETPPGRRYDAMSEADPFFRHARFLSSAELFAALSEAGFEPVEAVQTVFASPATEDVAVVRPGTGEGLFAVHRATRPDP